MKAIEWINKRFGSNLEDEDLFSIKDFSLIWNVFEGKVCDGYFSINEVEKLLEHKQFEMADFHSHLAYFQNRYVTSEAINERFTHLHFRVGDREDLVREVLLGIRTDQKEISLALIIIIYRFRCNSFHGLKEITLIDQQKDNFENANTFLIKLIDSL